MGEQALAGAASAVKAQQEHLQTTINTLTEKVSALNNLKKCATCPGHPQKIALSSEEVTAAKAAVNTAKADLQKIKVNAKADIDNSAQNNVRTLGNQMDEAKRRLKYLEKKSIKALQAVSAKGQAT